MTKKLLILLFLFVKITGNAQTNQKHSLNEFVSDFIKTQKTDTLFAYESFHAGDLKIIDYSSDDGKEVCFDDLTNHPIYIFWKEKGKTYFSKINYCYEYSNILIENDTFWEIYSSNKSIIENEKVKPFQYIAIEKSKKTKYTIGVGNSYFQILQIITNGKKNTKTI
ncbi:hypothetical protein C8C82_3352 [Flavobacterium sp. 81]|uniref:hypothetical protein n=1 Tax=Flavobacterium sp. 81 TaxID=2135621 RepID=UPI000EAC8E45|nr:hypothetical protein [Flavobacterium sp. 81]RKR11322.1 hypothetical protein C8C82_3352 [Flavobacterium sp. 81]